MRAAGERLHAKASQVFMTGFAMALETKRDFEESRVLKTKACTV
jgi:hypothetical protein